MSHMCCLANLCVYLAPSFHLSVLHFPARLLKTKSCYESKRETLWLKASEGNTDETLFESNNVCSRNTDSLLFSLLMLHFM